MTDTPIKETNERKPLPPVGLVTYHASELDERKKNDWQLSKQVVKKFREGKVGFYK